MARTLLSLALVAALSLACGARARVSEPAPATPMLATPTSTVSTPTLPPETSPTPSPESPTPSPEPTASIPPVGVYEFTRGPIRPDLADVSPRVYVPNEHSGTVSVIDPVAMKVIDQIKVGKYPQHVGPSPDMTKLYVNDEGLTEIDPRTGKVLRVIKVEMPYNLYFTPDGTRAIVVAEDLHRLDFYAYPEWTFIRSVSIPWKGIDHLDFSADGTYLIATTEFDGVIVKVDLREMAIVASAKVAKLPVDVRLCPDGAHFFISDQGRHGVILFDAVAMREVGFLPTGRGTHGLTISRDTRSLYVSERQGGRITVIDTVNHRITAQWFVGGSPDMLQVSPDGRQLWTGDRFLDTVRVIDTASGKVIAQIKVGKAPHGLTYFPQPGRISLGHNGVFR
jgi:YVTN family beta-propeller protein